MKNLILTLTILSFYAFANAQTATQTVKGKVLDMITHETLIGASIVIMESDPIKGAITDYNGVFSIENVPVGRHNFEIRMLGYQNYIASNILVSSGKEVVMEIELKEGNVTLNEVVVTADADKNKTINSMATLSSRQFSVEQTQRFAGGMSDPARLVSSFAGVANPSINSNGISVRGNSPSGLLWRIEGVEVPSPNHFANLSIAGAGLMTALSSQVMGNSDFYTGAFPSEYGNATSGVFDIKLRKGNYSKREYTLSAGVLGLEFSTEGPFKKGREASYLLNYRYSTLALMGHFLPSDAGILKYQDLSYKINVPTKTAGTFSLWAVSGYDGIDTEARAKEEWESIADRDNSQMTQYMYASGLNHKMFLGEKSILNSSISLSGSGLDFMEQRLNEDLQAHPQSNAQKANYNLALQSNWTNYLSEHHTNRMGLTYTHRGYDMNIKLAPASGSPLQELSTGKGQTDMFQVYSASKIDLTRKLELNGGVHLMFFPLNESFSAEPRAAIKYLMSPNQNIALAYGRHSRVEDLPVYFVKQEGALVNKDLKLMKSDHVVLSYNVQLAEKLNLTVEPYYQYLSNVPVAPDSYVSIINTQNSLFFDEDLESSGTARNMGVDITLERFLSNGMYYMIAGSVFDSKYTAADGIERNTRFNKNYVINGLIGKEWQVGKNKNNLVSANLRMNYLGGNRIEAIDTEQSKAVQSVVYGEQEGQVSFTEKLPDLPIVSFTASYRINKKNFSSVWSLQVLNATQTKDFGTHIYNVNTESVEAKFNSIMIPNLSYKIEF